jgi:small subunit ribosomal protein S21
VIEDSENLEKAIKRFKRMVEKEGIIREFKKREYFEKPSTIKNRKNKTLQRKLLKKTRTKGKEFSSSSSSSKSY